jgi:general secretion pathway protein I
MKLATATHRHRGGDDASSRQQGGRSSLAARGSWRRGATATPATGRRRQAAFTLAEVLAAMLFLAIVIPAAVEALHVASLAGEVAARKGAAGRVADFVLNESVIMTNWNGGVQNGTITEGALDYRWTLTSQPWTQDAMELLTAKVTFPAQGRNYSVELSTLAPLGGTPNQPVPAMSLR